jgi:diguanylate cyclase (GGDEF)-like protein
MGSKRPGRESSSEIPSFLGDDGDVDGTKTDVRVATKPPPSVRDRPILIFLAGSNVGEMHALKHQETVIGRSSTATIRIEDDGVSRRHARVVVQGGEVFVEDLGSANGTLLNGNRIVAKEVLKDGDKLALGSTVILKFTYTDEIEQTYQRKLLEGAVRDGLTHAFNKRHLLERLAPELAFAKRHSTPLSLVMLDVDHFKRVNDSFGHPAGDTVLVELAKAVQATIRKEDLFARFGGEEFAILCRSVDVANAAILAERVREIVAALVIEHEGQRIPITISLGVAGLHENTDTPEKLIAAADAALYQAKQTGRNRVVIG